MELTKNTKLLSFGNFLDKLSSEMVFPILPFFIVSFLGAPVIALGIMEAIGAAASSAASLFSTIRYRNKKKLIALGNLLSVVSKWLIATSFAWQPAVFFRIIERVGSGIGKNKKEAISSAEKKNRHVAFFTMMGNVGALTGPLVALFLLIFLSSDFQMIILLSVIPIAISLILSLLTKYDIKKNKKTFRLPEKEFLIKAVLFALPHFSIAFFLLRAIDYFPLIFIPVLYLAYQISRIFFATPSGFLIERIGEKKTMIIGILLFAVAASLAAFSLSSTMIFIAFALAGTYAAISDAIVVARQNLDEPQGVSSFCHTTLKIASIPANIMVGLMWESGVQLALALPLLLAFFSIFALFVKK